jgi:hypothetical protein
LWVAAGESDPAPKPQPQKGTKEAYFSASRTGNEKSNELVKTGQFYFPRLQFQCHEDVPDKWDVHPIGDQKLREQIRKLTNINILTDPVVVNLDKPEELCRYPYVFMTSEGTFDFSDSNLKVLREYLLRGGFVLADDCVLNQKGDLFYRSFVQQANRLFPDNPMRPIPLDHEIFNCFFKLEQGAPHLQGVKHPAMGLFEKDTGRLMCVVTSGDIHCGWVGFSSFSQKGIRESIEMGVNVVVYCLTH